MSPEVDLLERLSAENLSLHGAAYASCYRFRDLAHAQRVVSFYLRRKVVELYDERSDTRSPIPYRSSRWLLIEAANWEPNSSYRLRLTTKGYDVFIESSESFFDDLFA